MLRDNRRKRDKTRRIIRITSSESDEIGLRVGLATALSNFILKKVAEAYEIDPSEIPMEYQSKFFFDVLQAFVKPIVEK